MSSQLAMSGISVTAPRNAGREEIKHYAESSFYRYLDDEPAPYTKTPVLEFKAGTSVDSNPDESSSSQTSDGCTPIDCSRPHLARKIGHQLSHSRLDKLMDGECGSEADQGRGTGSPKLCWTDGEETKRGDDGKTRPTRTGQRGHQDGGKDGSVPSSDPEELTMSSRHVLAATAFVWLPLCRPAQTSGSNRKSMVKSDWYYEEAHKCVRLKERRNAIADPHHMAMTQETRERIQKEIEHRKTSMARKVSRYFRAIAGDDYEVDLI